MIDTLKLPFLQDANVLPRKAGKRWDVASNIQMHHGTVTIQCVFFGMNIVSLSQSFNISEA